MKTSFRKSFTRDLKRIKNKSVLLGVQQVIQGVEAASKLDDIKQLKKMVGTVNFYRIRLGEYRLGIVAEKGAVEFVRCLHRRDLYRFFP
jgi:mRNA interferase RelE/StbE